MDDNNDEISINNDFDGNNATIYYEEEDEELLQYLVKYRSKSYLHCKWINYRHLIKKVDDYLALKSKDEDGDIHITKKKKNKNKTNDDDVIGILE